MTARRVRHAHDRRAAELLRGDSNHNARLALDELAAGGHLVVAETERDAYLAKLRRWWEHETTGRHHDRRLQHDQGRTRQRRAMPTTSRRDGIDQNHHRSRQPQIRYRRPRRSPASIDRTLTAPSGPKRHVINGSTGTVIRLDPQADIIVVDFDGLGPIELPRSYFAEHEPGSGKRAGLELAYAVTSHGVQGATLEDSTSIFRPNTSQAAAAYVNLTRGKHSNMAIVTATPDTELEPLPTDTEPDIVNDIVRALTAPRTEPALTLDPSDHR